MPFWPLAESTLPSGIGPPIVVRVEVPSTITPLSALPTAVSLSAPMPKKLAWIVVSLELLTRRPLPPLPLMTL